jgi:endonuclease/exonuclease/phosphatase family metal-dependent hydrolase
LLGLKQEAQAPVKARLTWGDMAFGLEIARWRTRRLLNRSELLRRIAGIKREQAPIARPGLLLIEITGLNRGKFDAALRAGCVPFLKSLLEREHYELVPLTSEQRLTQLADRAETEFQSGDSASARAARRLSGWNPHSEVRTGVQVAVGQPLVRLKLAAAIETRSPGPGEPDQRMLKGVDRTIGRLCRKALLSATVDYEVWIVAEGQPEGFALLPANTVALDGHKGAADPEILEQAMIRAWGRPVTEAPLPHRARRENHLRVMTYNIHSCVGLDGKLAPSRIARIIRGFDPDIVALQEVDLKRARSKGEDQAARLARELAMHVAFCCTADRSWERYGHALLTRSPAKVIASGLFSGDQQLAEPRGAMLAQLEIAGRAVYVANTHFGLKSADRAGQAETLLGPEWLGRIPADSPQILCGDFNMTPGSRPYDVMTQRFKDAQVVATIRQSGSTFPAPIPVTRLDFVFVSENIIVERVAAVRSSQTRVASDHLPLVADLQLQRE